MSTATFRTQRRAAVGRRAAQLLGTHGILILFSLVALLPFMSILLVSLYPSDQPAAGLSLPQSLNWGNYVRAWDAAHFSSLMASSAIVALVVVPLGSALCVLTGYAFGCMQFRGKNVLFYAFLIGLLMPFEATIVPLYYDLRAVGLVNTYPGLILPETALFLSFGTFWMRAHFLSTPRSLVEAARLDGANSWSILWKVLMPAARPAVTTMMVLFFIWSWNEFLLALVLAQDPKVQTAPAGLGLFFGEHTTDISGLAAAAIIMTIPSLAVYVMLQRHFIQGVTSGSVKG
jgi:raffinose/stachyose/melibiose transport system permease protein